MTSNFFLMKFHKAFYKTFSPYFPPKYFKNISMSTSLKDYSDYKHNTSSNFQKIPKVCGEKIIYYLSGGVIYCVIYD